MSQGMREENLHRLRSPAAQLSLWPATKEAKMLRAVLFSVCFCLPTLARADACGGQNLFHTMATAELDSLRDAAAAHPFPEGLHWRATKGARTLTFFGSYHLPHALTEAHLERLLPLAEAADVTYFEMDAADTQRFERAVQQEPDMMFASQGPTLPELLTPAEWASVQSKMQARGFPGFLTAKMKPFFVSMMLGMSPCKLRLMQSGELGIDRALAQALAAEGLPTRSIEDYRTAAKLFDAFSPEKQIELLRLSLLELVNPDDMMETLYQSYIAEEIALIWAYTKALSLQTGGPSAADDFALFEKLLLTDRNAAWLAELAAAPENTMLVVVGAAHLSGEAGLLNLLAAEGYTITRLPLN